MKQKLLVNMESALICACEVYILINPHYTTVSQVLEDINKGDEHLKNSIITLMAAPKFLV